MSELDTNLKEKLKLSQDECADFSESDDDFHDLSDDIKNFKGCSHFESLNTQNTQNNAELGSKENGDNYINKEIERSDENDKNEEEKEQTDLKSKKNFLEERKKLEDMLSPEEKQKRKIQAEEIKNEGNKWFSEKNFSEAITCYSQALQLCPLIYPRERAIYYSNRAACSLQENNYKEVIQDCTNAIESDPSFVKAIVRRAKAFEASDRLEEALKDYQRVLEIDRGNGPALEACQRLPSQIQEKNEKMKQEMFGQLKQLGNMILKPFGLSTQNFKVNQDPTSGGYSINFQQQ